LVEHRAEYSHTQQRVDKVIPQRRVFVGRVPLVAVTAGGPQGWSLVEEAAPPAAVLTRRTRSTDVAAIRRGRCRACETTSSSSSSSESTANVRSATLMAPLLTRGAQVCTLRECSRAHPGLDISGAPVCGHKPNWVLSLQKHISPEEPADSGEVRAPRTAHTCSGSH
jgi:hypothetical protein